MASVSCITLFGPANLLALIMYQLRPSSGSRMPQPTSASSMSAPAFLSLENIKLGSATPTFMACTRTRTFCPAARLA